MMETEQGNVLAWRDYGYCELDMDRFNQWVESELKANIVQTAKEILQDPAQIENLDVKFDRTMRYVTVTVTGNGQRATRQFIMPDMVS